MLSRFKYSDYYKDSIELLLYFIEKRPDLIMDFYFVFSDRLSFDKYSHKFDYVKEYMLVETIWDNSKQGENEIVSFLLLVTLKELRSEEDTSELQSRGHLVCCLLLVKKNSST